MCRAVLFCVTAVGAGCTSGSVVMPAGFDDFGTVRSAVWMVVTTTDDSDVDVDHSLVISNTADLCDEARAAYPQVAQRTRAFREDVLDDLVNLDNAGKIDAVAFNQQLCHAYEAYFGELAEVSSGMIGAGTDLVSLSVTHGDGSDATEEPREGTYVYGSGPDPSADARWQGELSRYSENPYARASQAMRDADCDSLGEGDFWYGPIYAGNEDGLFPAPIDLVGGTLELTTKGDGWSLAITGAALEDSEGFEASASLERCDVSVEGPSF